MSSFSSPPPSFTALVGRLEHADSTQNFYRSLTPQDRATLDNTPLANNASGSANTLIRQLDPVTFQRLDYVRDTPANVARIDECVEACQDHATSRADLALCLMRCQALRLDYV